VADQDIGAISTDQRIIAITGQERIRASAPDHAVMPGAAIQQVKATVPGKRVVTGATERGIVKRRTGPSVVPGDAIEPVRRRRHRIGVGIRTVNALAKRIEPAEHWRIIHARRIRAEIVIFAKMVEQVR
jgi:hypothetical protein